MATDRLQSIEQFLDEAEEAVARLEWTVVRDRARAVVSLDQENADGLALLAVAESELGEIPASAQTAHPSPTTGATLPLDIAAEN